MPTTTTTADVAVNDRIRIIYRSECPKLTPRGKGTLAYEFGVKDATGELFVRIAANSQGGTCSYEWLSLQMVEQLLNSREDMTSPFSATLFRKAFISRSNNNHGYLAAILKAVKVIAASPEQPNQLNHLSFDWIKDQLNHLKTEDVDLPDNVAAELQEREARKQQRKATLPDASTEPVRKRGRPKKAAENP